jgi:epoxyqueuosine reductase QueG
MAEVEIELKRRLFEKGATLAGVADLAPLKEIKTIPADLLEGFKSAISIAVAVPYAAFAAIKNQPNELYLHHYAATNNLLDLLALDIARFLEEKGGEALAIPCSQAADKKNNYGHISHKAVARLAGLGWIGKNDLLINRYYGGRLRFATVLTDFDLRANQKIEPNRCGRCHICAQACPAEAIKDTRLKDYPSSREEVLYFERCRQKLENDFARGLNLGKPICGICIKVCPFSRLKLKDKTKERE